MSAEDSKNSLLKEVMARLHQSVDAVLPAARVEADRRRERARARVSVQNGLILGYALAISVTVNVVVSYFALNPTYVYFATDRGNLIPMVPLSEPYKTQAEVIQYARDTLNAAFAMDFLNYQTDLERVRDRFTQGGFSSFLHALQNAGILERIKKERFNLSNTTQTGVITREGTVEGVHVWVVEMPLELRLVGQNTELPPQRFRATVRVERTTTLASRDAIVVAQVVTAPMEQGR